MCVPNRPFPTHLGHRPLPSIFFYRFFLTYRIWPNSSWKQKNRECVPPRLALSSSNNQFPRVKKKSVSLSRLFIDGLFRIDTLKNHTKRMIL